MGELCLATVVAALLILLPYSYALLGVDVNVPIAESAFSCMKQQNATAFVIVRCYESLGKPDPGCPSTYKAAQAAGMITETYFFPAFWQDPSKQVFTISSFFNESAINTTMMWFDVEEPPQWSSSCHENVWFLGNMTAAATELGIPHGIYTSFSMWSEMMCGSTAFSQLPLWYAEYDNQPSFDTFRPFGGWTIPSTKQYAGNKAQCKTGVDLNYRL